MARIENNFRLCDTIHQLTILAPQIARKCKPGQFVIIRTDQQGERIPLTIADSDPENGTIDLIVQAVGVSTKKLSARNAGENILDIVGPLGTPTNITPRGTVLLVGGGVGVATLYPMLKEHKRIGNTVVSVLGARTRDLIIMEDKMAVLSDELIVTTDDGSAGVQGRVTDILPGVIERHKPVGEVIAVGPVVMMRAVVDLTRRYGVPTTVSLSPIMVDGTGMCGGCRVTVAGESRFACVDGPEFDGHHVDFDGLIRRLGMYRDKENHTCRLSVNKEN